MLFGLTPSLPGFIPWGLIIASPFVGSFLGAAIMRIPAGKQILWGRSSCDHCGTPLAARDLMPVVSWMVLHARCRHCGARLPVFYPLIELAAAAVALIAAGYARGVWIVPATLAGWLTLAVAGIVWRQRHRSAR